MSFKITTLSAFIATGDDGDEGIIGQKIGDTFYPFVMADEDRIKQLRPMAEKIAQVSKKAVKFVRFSVREDIETL